MGSFRSPRTVARTECRRRTISLATIQQQLREIYELPAVHDVKDYLLTCPVVAAQLDPAMGSRHVRERLLVREDPGAVSLSLYLERELVEKLAEDVPSTPCGLQDYCLALEGVSHFLYLVWNASHDRPVSRLEMELQAEVDKFVLLRRSMEDTGAQPLLRRLFREASFDAALDGGEQRRYRHASDYAERYCRNLETDYFRSGKEGPLLNELRRFYRLGEADKIRRINSH